MGEARTMRQVAPYPDDLAAVVARLRYRRHLGWRVWLEDLVRDHASSHGGASAGLTLIVQRHGPDTYHPARQLAVNHYFPVPPATFDRDTWTRWVFDRLGDVDVHERMEDFALAEAAPAGGQDPERVTRPYAPNHGPGRNPYVVHSYAADTDRRTSFRGALNPA
jgi:hypothetical protein